MARCWVMWFSRCTVPIAGNGKSRLATRDITDGN
ncbi:Uncharacterised protein [Mycobacteroides abscessus subsp. abscessus]|nr:Uncharacterised protein [Mycobacteroides abscessus subsp. abscessus]